MNQKEPIFTDKRRDLLAKAIMDIVKIAIAAAFASEFFFKFTSWLRAALLIGIILIMTAGFFICPREEKTKGG